MQPLARAKNLSTMREVTEGRIESKAERSIEHPHKYDSQPYWALSILVVLVFPR